MINWNMHDISKETIETFERTEAHRQKLLRIARAAAEAKDWATYDWVQEKLYHVEAYYR